MKSGNLQNICKVPNPTAYLLKDKVTESTLACAQVLFIWIQQKSKETLKNGKTSFYFRIGNRGASRQNL